MKLVVATTTIHIPSALKAFRAADADVFFCIAGDRKSPDADIVRELSGLGNFQYMSIDQQHERGYACDKLLGENTIGRRSIALLEALRMKADAIVFWDDDNLMMSTDYFDRFEMVLNTPVLQPHQYDANGGWSGIKVSGFNGWFDVGQLLDPVAPHRGFPSDAIPLWQASPVVDAKIGVAAGICLGDPDIDAITRLANRPKPLDVHRVSELLRAGIVVDPGTKTVFNSQNTAFIRELAPCFLMVPQFGRYDDIFASLIAQRVMRERGLHVHFGQPFVWQQRNPHNLLKDLAAETWGMNRITEFAAFLDQVDLSHTDDVAVKVLSIYQLMETLEWIPPEVIVLAEAWIDDVEKVL